MNELEKLLKWWGFAYEKKFEGRYTKYTLSRGDYFSPEQLSKLGCLVSNLEYLEANLQGEMVITISNARVKK